MRTFNIGEAKLNFCKLIEAVGEGEEIVIAKAGRPMAKLVPVHSVYVARTPGAMKGRIRVREDFDSPLPANLQASFEGTAR